MATKTVKKARSGGKSQRQVKTWRVLYDGLRVGHSVRNFGDFIPEAKTLPTQRTLINTGRIEEVLVNEDEFQEWEADQAIRDAELMEELGIVETPKPAPKKRVAKKTVAKKSATKKAVAKKGNSSGRLEEQEV